MTATPNASKLVRMMTTLTDAHDVTETLVLRVAAAPADVLGGGARRFGLTWRGRVDITFDMTAELDEDGRCFVTSRRRYHARTAAARAELSAHWREIRALADGAARRALRAEPLPLAA